MLKLLSKWRFTLRASKTVCIISGNVSFIDEPNRFLGTETIQKSDSIEILGTVFSPSSSSNLHVNKRVQACTPLCKSNGTFFSDMDTNELTSVLHKYKTPVTKCCISTCCWVNLVGIRHLIVKIMPEKHVWGPDFLMSDSLYIFQLFEN